MKLQHYLGGLEGLGPVSTETRVFVETWETRIFGIHTAMMALSSQLSLPATPSAFSSIWTWADLRKGAESLNPFDYFKYRYYEKWLGGISGYFIDKGYITAEELDALTEEYYADPSIPVPTAGDQAIDDRVVQYLVEGDSPKREAEVSFDFTVGDLVSIRNVHRSSTPGCLAFFGVRREPSRLSTTAPTSTSVTRERTGSARRCRSTASVSSPRNSGPPTPRRTAASTRISTPITWNPHAPSPPKPPDAQSIGEHSDDRPLQIPRRSRSLQCRAR